MKNDFDASVLEYIQSGIQILRVREEREVLNGRAVDMIMQILKSADLPMDPSFMQAQENLVSYFISLLTQSDNYSHMEHRQQITSCHTYPSWIHHQIKQKTNNCSRIYLDKHNFIRSMRHLWALAGRLRWIT